MGILIQIILRFDPPNLEVKASVIFMFYGFCSFFYSFLVFCFVFCLLLVSCPPSCPLTQLARPRSESVPGNFLEFFKKLSGYNRKAYTFRLNRTTDTLKWARSCVKWV